MFDDVIASSSRTSIKNEDISYFFIELLKWLYEDKIASNIINHDLLQVYDTPKNDLYVPSFPLTNLIKKYEFSAITKEDLETFLEYDLFRHSRHSLNPARVSYHRVFLYSFLKLIKQNITKFCKLVASYHQIPQILDSSRHKGEILIIQKIVEDLQIFKKNNCQLIPVLFCDHSWSKLRPKRDYFIGLRDTTNKSPTELHFAFEYIFSKSSSSVFENKLIAILNARLELLSGIYKIPKDGKKDDKSLQTIEDIIMSDNLERFLEFEESFIEIGSIQKKKDDSLWWIEKPIRLIAFIIILHEHGYINRKKFMSFRTQCRKIFEKRYNINLGQSFERARVEKNIKEIAHYKTFPVYKDIILLH